ncbi:hypothetical protein BJX68DRAFT_247171 [Aspergillus pseudodeflectus]|uniref:Uncharacterized protein n=1 Tax=Aspergillus pseudodeflectus TaxID=176178 RepID=A0ABR4JIY8_9EURO
MLRRPVNVGTRVERIDQGQGKGRQLLGGFCLAELQRKAWARADRRKGLAHMLCKLTLMTGWTR